MAVRSSVIDSEGRIQPIVGPSAETFSVVITRDVSTPGTIRACLRSHVNGNIVPEDILVDTPRGLETNNRFQDWLRRVIR